MKTLHISIIVISSVMISVLVISNIANIQACTPYENCSRVLPHSTFSTASFNGNHATYGIPYSLSNGTLVASLLDLPAKELLFNFNATDNGKLTVELPRKIIDSTRDEKDKPYLVFVGTWESGTNRARANEIQNNNETRTLEINFTKGYDQIGIVGTYFVENNSTTKIHNGYGAWPPLQQYKKGFDAQDVVCRQGFVLVMKKSDETPACVKSATAQKLVERGWGIMNISWIGDTDTIEEKNGTLSGNVVLAGGPRSGPKANYEVDVYATDGIKIVEKTFSDINGNYSMQLPAGNYTIYAPDYPTRQTHFVSVFSGKNTVFNIVYGTGYK